MDAFNAYKIYLALKSHFNNKTYDYFKYNGRTRASHKTFENRSDKYFFHKLANHNDCVNYLASNFFEGDCWVGDLVNEQSAEKTYRAWRKRIDSLTYIFTQDLNKMDEDYNANLIVEDGQYPKLLKMYLRKEISPETLLILNDITPFLGCWNRRITDKVLWPSHHHKLKKYRPFFTIDLDKYKQIVLKQFSKGS
jgi:hypothetical protein